MALDANDSLLRYNAPEKELYEIGEIPPIGYVPPKMLAWTIRRERHGEPTNLSKLRLSIHLSLIVMTF